MPRWDMLIKAGRDLKKVPPPPPTHPIPQNNNVAVLRTPCMLQTQAPRATVQIGIPFIRKSPDLLHQENFSKSTPHDQISVKHPAEGWRGDWPSPLTVFLYPNINKRPQGNFPAKKCQSKLKGSWEVPRISSILSCISEMLCLRARAHSCA